MTRKLHVYIMIVVLRKCHDLPFLTLHAVVPAIQLTSPSTEVVVEQHTVLVCIATGFPIPSVQWRQDGNDLSITLDGRITFNEVGLLELISFYSGSGLDNNNEKQLQSKETVSMEVVELLSEAGLQIEQLTDLAVHGVVGLVVFTHVLREDNGVYQCQAENMIPPQFIRVISNGIQLNITGMLPL